MTFRPRALLSSALLLPIVPACGLIIPAFVEHRREATVNPTVKPSG